MYFFQWADGVITVQEFGPNDDQYKIIAKGCHLSVFHYDSGRLYQVFAVDDVRPYRDNYVVPVSAFEFGLPKVRFWHIGSDLVELPNLFAHRKPSAESAQLAASSYEPRPRVEYATT